MLKYWSQWPSSGFASLDEARAWVEHFVRWYNTEHRHQGKDKTLLAQRKAVLEQAKLANPTRWGSRPVRNCQPVGPVTLNPEKETETKQAA